MSFPSVVHIRLSWPFMIAVYLSRLCLSFMYIVSIRRLYLSEGGGEEGGGGEADVELKSNNPTLMGGNMNLEAIRPPKSKVFHLRGNKKTLNSGLQKRLPNLVMLSRNLD